MKKDKPCNQWLDADSKKSATEREKDKRFADNPVAEMRGALVTHPYKVMEALGTALKIACEDLADLLTNADNPPESMEALYVEYIARAGRKLLNYKADKDFDKAFSLAILTAVLEFFRQHVEQVNEEKEGKTNG